MAASCYNIDTDSHIAVPSADIATFIGFVDKAKLVWLEGAICFKQGNAKGTQGIGV